jgi:hypothetical protein
MFSLNKAGVGLILALFIALGIAATDPPSGPAPKNLKVFPKHMNMQDLRIEMDRIRAAMGVKCDYCHALKDSSYKDLDYASDAKPMKEKGRDMIRLTNKLNKKFFSFDKGTNTDKVAILNCNTCHRGKPRPGER